MILLESLSEYALSFNENSISDEVKEIGKKFFLDCLGCIVAGAHALPSRIAMEYCEEMYGDSRALASIIATDLKRNTASAAFVNGISSHFHDFDDVLPTLNGHPSAVVLPVVIALCEELRLGGMEALCAYITGVEVIDVVARGLNQEGHIHYSRGWHSTESLGIFGAAAAAGILLKLTKDQLVTALSMAASESSGLQGNFGTMTKAFHAGRGAEKGILAAKMAKKGFTANPNIMEMVGGFAFATTGEIGSEAMLGRMSSGVSVFENPGLTMKPYPCCKCNHNIIDAVYNLMQEYGFSVDDVEKVQIGAQPFFHGCLKYPKARTVTEGKFSANYNAALVLVNKRYPRISDFEGSIEDPELINAMEKVEMTIDDSIANGAYANGGWDTKVEVTLKNGGILKERVVYSRGESKNPLSINEVLGKMRDCLSVTLYPDKLEQVIQVLKDFEKAQSVCDLTKAISDAAKPLPRSME
jgi:2-methylcitrate dehydratase PrpD